LGVLLGLGGWQVARHFETSAENERRASQSALPPVSLAQALADPAVMRFRRVRAEGRFDHEREIYVYARSRNGNEGYYVMTPLRVEGGPAILVNRGWVPPERRDPQVRMPGQLVGRLPVTGVLREEPRRGYFMPDNDAAKNRWFWFDLAAMNRAAGIEGGANAYLEADATQILGGFPIGGQTQLRLPTPHLQYALTWFALAVALVVIFVLYHRKQAAS
jgi:surfeit locus 1 family protein